jgi:UDP-glucose 4-epimerase
MHMDSQSDGHRRALITGGIGFVGSHLAEALLRQGDQVTVIDDASTGRIENVGHLLEHPQFRHVAGSVADEVVIDQLVGECDIVFHLAAAVGVKLVVENPLLTIETNVSGTEVVLRAAHRHGTKVLIASTSEVYGKGSRIPFAEDDDVVLGPTRNSRWGYAASKMLDEFLGLAYYHQKGLPVVIFRLFNTVGPRQTGQYGMVVPRFVQAALRGEPLTVYGDGQQSRCFLHVSDAVDAMMKLAECPQAVGEVFNVGSTEQVTILELAQRVLKHVAVSKNGHEPIVYVPYEQAYAAGFEDMRRRVPDVSKIHRFTGWEPKHTLDEILRDVIASFAPDRMAKSTFAAERVAVA